MKRILCTILVFVMIFGLMACGGNDKGETTETAKRPVAADGYQLFEHEAITFAYPSNWTQTEQSGVVVLMDAADATTNITLAYEIKSNLYASMTKETFASQLQPSLEQAGMTISNVTVAQISNDYNGLTKIAYQAEVMGITMSQTMFIVASGNYNYIVSVTQLTADESLITAVQSTLCALQG